MYKPYDTEINYFTCSWHSNQPKVLTTRKPREKNLEQLATQREKYREQNNRYEAKNHNKNIQK